MILCWSMFYKGLGMGGLLMVEGGFCVLEFFISNGGGGFVGIGGVWYLVGMCYGYGVLVGLGDCWGGL